MGSGLRTFAVIEVTAGLTLSDFFPSFAPPSPTCEKLRTQLSGYSGSEVHEQLLGIEQLGLLCGDWPAACFAVEGVLCISSVLPICLYIFIA